MATSHKSSADPSPFSRPRSADDPADRHDRIARAAYRRAQERGFEPGHELDDWLEAEHEIDAAEPDDANEPH
jgi:Protein of unknown function (DUF2934)